MSRRAITLLAAAALLLLAGCGGDEPAKAEHVPANVWAASVCTTLKPWREQIGASTGNAQSLINKDTTPEQVKTILTGLLDDAAAASETARTALSAQPAPEVGGGEEIRTAVVAFLEGARDAYANASTSLSALDPAAAGFYDRVAETMTRLTQAYAAGPDLTSFESADLTKAFATVPECR